MSERDIVKQLNEDFKELLLSQGFKFLSSTNYFKRKIDSNRYECIYFVVQDSRNSEYELKFRFWIVLRDVDKAWSEMVGRKYKPSTFDSTLFELSENFLLEPGCWAVGMRNERDAEVIGKYIIDTICPWFNSIKTLADARDWLANKGKLGGWSWTTVLTMDYMLNDSEHLSRFLDSLAKDIESDPNLLQVVEPCYAPFKNFDRTFFRPVSINQDKFRHSRKELLEDERLEIDARIAQSLSYPDKFHSELYRVYVLLGSTDETLLRNDDGWMKVLKLMKPFFKDIQKVFMQFGSSSHKDSNLTIDIESMESLTLAAKRAASTVDDRGHVSLRAQSPHYTERRKEPPPFFFCCSSQIPSDGMTLRFDPFVLFALPDKTNGKFDSHIEALLRALYLGLRPKLSALQKRPFHLQSIAGVSESLIDAPLGIFRPGNKHMDDLHIDMLKGRWTQIRLED